MKIRKMAGHLIRRLNQISTQVFSRRLQDAGFDLTPVQFAAMDAIFANPDIDQAGVAGLIAYDRATIGGVIDRLEQKGYVQRSVSKRDRRAREVRLTEAGEALYQRVLPVVADLQSDILNGLSDTERALFLDLAEKVVFQDAEDDRDASIARP